MTEPIDQVAQQMLDLTRVVSNAPGVGPGEPLRVDVIPGVPVFGVAEMLLNSLGVLRLEVHYQVFRDDKEIKEGFVKTPFAAPGSAELLSSAFTFTPRLRFVSHPQPQPVLPSAAKHKLKVTLTIHFGDASLSRAIDIPFAVPTIDIPLVPAVCVCSKFKELSTVVPADGEDGDEPQFLVLVAPGGPSTVGEIVTAYNRLISTLMTLQGVLDVASIALAPLKLLVQTLTSLPKPFLSTDAWVLDFDDFGDFDDEMSSFLVVAPTGTALQFSDEANPASWDVSSDVGIKTYTPIDLLQLVGLAADSPAVLAIKDYEREKLGVSAEAVQLVKDALGAVDGITGDSLEGLQLGLAVLYVGNLAANPDENPDYDRIEPFLFYETPGDTDEEVQNDVASARWLPAPSGI